MKKVGGLVNGYNSYSPQHVSTDQARLTTRKTRFSQIGAPSGALLLLAMLTACGEGLSCSATPTKQLVDKIARDELKKALPPGDPQANQVGLAMNEIITTEKTATRTACKAKLQMTVPGAGTTPADMPITYHVEKTDDGRLYVTIFGL